HFRGRPAERPRMLAADDRLVGVVVEVDQLLAPADPDRLTRGEHDAHRGLEAARPEFGAAEGGGRPVERPHARPKLATTREKLQILLKLRAPKGCVCFKIHWSPRTSEAPHGDRPVPLCRAEIATFARRCRCPSAQQQQTFAHERPRRKTVLWRTLNAGAPPRFHGKAASPFR